MASILYEPSSIRSDYGILYLTEGEPCLLPFVFNVTMKSPSGEPITYSIEPDSVINFLIKPVNPICCCDNKIEKKVTNIINNVACLELTREDMEFFVGGNSYEMSATLNTKERIMVLIKRLPIKIQEVV